MASAIVGLRCDRAALHGVHDAVFDALPRNSKFGPFERIQSAQWYSPLYAAAQIGVQPSASTASRSRPGRSTASTEFKGVAGHDLLHRQPPDHRQVALGRRPV